MRNQAKSGPRPAHRQRKPGDAVLPARRVSGNGQAAGLFGRYGHPPGRGPPDGRVRSQSIRGIRLSGNAFRFLGVPPLFGRTLQPSDIRATGEPESVTVLSFKRWHDLFGSDTNVLGKTLRLDDQPHTIVGVMPPRFRVVDRRRCLAAHGHGFPGGGRGVSDCAAPGRE